jgi:hypothetical protein
MLPFRRRETDASRSEREGCIEMGEEQEERGRGEVEIGGEEMKEIERKEIRF